MKSKVILHPRFGQRQPIHRQRTERTLTQADIKAIIRALQAEGLIPPAADLGQPVQSRPDLPLPF